MYSKFTYSEIMENNFNKDFEDFAWSEMQKLLDRDLPVAEKKRRRGLVFWLFAISGLIAFIGGGAFIYGQLKTNKTELNNAELNKNQLVINNAELNKNQLVINNAELNKNQLVINNAELNKNQLAINNAELNKNQLAINNAELNKNQLTINNSELNNNQLTINNAELNKKQLAINNAELNTPFNQTIIAKGTPQYLGEKDVVYKVDDANTTQGTPIPVELIAELNRHQLNLIKLDSLRDISNDQLNAEPKIALQLRCVAFGYSKKPRFGVETGVHTEGSKKIDGWQLGVVLSKQFRWNWSVSAGLNYRKTAINSDSLTYYQARELSGYNNQIYAQNAVVPANKFTLNRLNYVELPIILNYNFNRKWSIAAGIKTAYLARANFNISSDSTLFFLNSKTNSGLSSADLASLRDVKLLGLKRWDFAAIGGVYFKPTDKIQLSLRYDYGFRNTLNRPNWSAYNRFLGVNVAYYFK